MRRNEERRSVFSFHHEDGATVLRGDIDIGTLAEVQNALEAALTESGGQIVLRLDQVGFVDSAGVKALLGLWRGAKGAPVVLRHPTPALRRLLRSSGVEQLFSFEDEETPLVGEAAASDLRTRPAGSTGRSAFGPRP